MQKKGKETAAPFQYGPQPTNATAVATADFAQSPVAPWTLEKLAKK